MRFRVDQSVFDLFPDLVIGLGIARNVMNSGENHEVASALAAAESETARKFEGAPVADHPNIAVWREAYRGFGAKPKDYPSSIENLIRRAAKGHRLPHINLLVDIYNTISLRYLLPVGGEDLDRITGDVVLTRASAGEPPVRLLGENEDRPPREGEVIYRDDLSAICRRFNWKEADRTKFTEHTRNAVLVIEGLPPADESLVDRAVSELATMVQKFCGGDVTTATITLRQPVFPLTPQPT